MPQPGEAAGLRPSHAPQENGSAAWAEYQRSVLMLSRTVGNVRVLPDGLSNDELYRMSETINAESPMLTSFSDLSFANQVYWKQKAVQHAADLESEGPRDRIFNPGEYIIASQLVTYHEGMDSVVRATSNVLHGYEEWQDFIAGLPKDAQAGLSRKRREAVTYIDYLNRGLNERIAFANAARANQQLLVDPDNEERQKHRTLLMQNPALDEDSRSILQKNDPQAILDRRQFLERRIIKTLSGSEKIPGVTDGFLPQYLYADILQARYTHILEQQKQLTYSRTIEREGGRVAMELLEAERRTIMSEMTAITYRVGMQQQDLAELFGLHHLFEKYDVTGALRSPEGSTPGKEKTEASAAMRELEAFHLGRVDAMVDTATKEFVPGWFEKVRDGLVSGTVDSTQFALGVIKLLNSLDLGTDALKEPTRWAQDYLAGPLAESMGWPRDPETHQLKAKLTPEERGAILAKLGMLKTILDEFQSRKHGESIRSTTDALRTLDATEAVSIQRIGRPREPLPVEAAAVTPDAVPAKIAEYEKRYGNREDAVATLHVVLLVQLRREWGSFDAASGTGTGFIGSYTAMLNKVENLIGIQLGLADSAYLISERYIRMAEMLAIAAGAVGVGTIAAGVAGTAGVAKLGFHVARSGARTAVRIFRPGMPGKAVETAMNAEKTLLTPFQYKMNVLGKVANGAAIAYDSYRLYDNAREIGYDNERLNTVKGQLIAELISAGFTQDRNNADRFVHTVTGVAVSLRTVTEDLDTQRYIQWARTGVIGAEVGTLVAAAVVGGPVGWTIAGVAVTVELGTEAALSAYDSKVARDFIAGCPPWLLIRLRTGPTVKRSEYDALLDASGSNLLESTPAEKQLIRNKIAFSFFNHELQACAPELQREIFAGRNNAAGTNAFFEGDFQSFVLPYAALRLYQTARAKGRSVDFNQMKKGQIDRGMLIAADLTEFEIRSAVREAAAVYVRHLREQRFIATLDEVRQLSDKVRANPGDHEAALKLADAQLIRLLLGSQEVFGKPLQDLITVESLDRNAGKTRMRLAVDQLLAQAESGRTDYVVDGKNIAGLPEEQLNFGTQSSVFDRLIPDPAERLNLERISPLSTSEPESRVEGGRRWFFDGIPQGAADMVARSAASNIWREADTRVVVPQDVTEARARQMITEGAIQYIDAHVGVARIRQGEGPGTVIGNRLVPVFSDVEGVKDRLLNRILSDAGDHGSDLCAVIVQGRKMPSDQVVLATFVYGEPGAYRFVQNAIVTGNTAQTADGYYLGVPLAFKESVFRQMPLGRVFTDSMDRVIARSEQRRRLDVAKNAVEAGQRSRKKEQVDEQKRDPDIRRTDALEMLKKARNNELSEIADRFDDSGLRMRHRDPVTGKDVLVTFTNARRPAAISAPPAHGRHAADSPHLLVVSGGEERTVSVDLASLSDERVAEADRALMRSFLTATIEGDDLGSLRKIVALFPYDNVVSSWRTNHLYRAELLQELLPFYKKAATAEKAQEFLNDLLDRLIAAKAVTASSKASIVAWFKANGKKYEKK